MEVQFAVAKVNKYAMSESGDTLEMIERPHGGISMVLVDGQRSGKSAKNISNVVARKAVQLLAEGVRDGAVARAANDYLYTYRSGKVSATLNILSVDTRTRTLVISRNNESPVFIHTAEAGFSQFDEPSESVGYHPTTRPVIIEMPISPGTIVVAFTDGLRHAGTLSGKGEYDPFDTFQALVSGGTVNAADLVDRLLSDAVARDDGRPRDDISVVALSVQPKGKDEARRLSGRLVL